MDRHERQLYKRLLACAPAVLIPAGEYLSAMRLGSGGKCWTGMSGSSAKACLLVHQLHEWQLCKGLLACAPAVLIPAGEYLISYETWVWGERPLHADLHKRAPAALLPLGGDFELLWCHEEIRDPARYCKRWGVSMLFVGCERGVCDV
eukprot:1158284-Pelagomonas_calceolata.AAC.3